MSDQDNVSLALARRDLSDIASLRNSDAFTRYWLRRLHQPDRKDQGRTF